MRFAKTPEAVLGILGCVGTMTPFLPFAFDTSPMDVLLESKRDPDPRLTLSATHAFLAIFISIAVLRAAFLGSLSRAEAVVGCLVSAALAGGMLLSLLSQLSSSRLWPGQLIAWVAWALVILGAIALIGSLLRRGAALALVAVISMQSVYSANALCSLLAYCGYLGSGAAVALVTVALYGAHAAILSIRSLRPEPAQPCVDRTGNSGFRA